MKARLRNDVGALGAAGLAHNEDHLGEKVREAQRKNFRAGRQFGLDDEIDAAGQESLRVLLFPLAETVFIRRCGDLEWKFLAIDKQLEFAAESLAALREQRNEVLLGPIEQLIHPQVINTR